jgi:hypothetical protein
MITEDSRAKSPPVETNVPTAGHHRGARWFGSFATMLSLPAAGSHRKPTQKSSSAREAMGVSSGAQTRTAPGAQYGLSSAP